MTAKTTPNPPYTVTAFWPTGTNLLLCCRRVTLTKTYRRAVRPNAESAFWYNNIFHKNLENVT